MSFVNSALMCVRCAAVVFLEALRVMIVLWVCWLCDHRG